MGWFSFPKIYMSQFEVKKYTSIPNIIIFRTLIQNPYYSLKRFNAVNIVFIVTCFSFWQKQNEQHSISAATQ